MGGLGNEGRRKGGKRRKDKATQKREHTHISHIVYHITQISKAKVIGE